jgi:AcrR family transcriptional regulator
VPSVTSSCQGSTRNFLLTVAVEHDGGYGAFVERKRVQLRREEILSATVRQIQGHGIAALRIADVAAVLGVSPALVIYHFQTKENLVAEAFRHAAEHDLLKVNRLVRGSGSVPSRLMSTLGWYAPTGRARGWLLWIDGWATAMRDHTLAEVISDLDEQWRQAIADLISEGVAAGDFTVEDPQEAAGRITALLDGLAVRTLVHGGGLSRPMMLEWLTRQTAWELGIAPEALTRATTR